MKARKGKVCILLSCPGSDIVYRIYDPAYDRYFPYVYV